VPTMDPWHGKNWRVDSIEQRELIGQILAQEPLWIAEPTRYIGNDPLDYYRDTQGRFDVEDMESEYVHYGEQQFSYESSQQSDVSRSYRPSIGLAELFYLFRWSWNPSLSSYTNP
jgi:hypothetical protein